MAKKGKSGRILIKLSSPESKIKIFSEKNNKNTKERLKIKKYAPDLRKRVLYTED